MSVLEKLNLGLENYIASTDDSVIETYNPATGKLHKVSSRGINYPAIDKSIVIKDGKKTSAAHWFKDDGWETGYGIKDFDKLGKGKFIPDGTTRKNGALNGTWTGGQVGDELIKQTVKIID